MINQQPTGKGPVGCFWCMTSICAKLNQSIEAGQCGKDLGDPRNTGTGIFVDDAELFRLLENLACDFFTVYEFVILSIGPYVCEAAVIDPAITDTITEKDFVGKINLVKSTVMNLTGFKTDERVVITGEVGKLAVADYRIGQKDCVEVGKSTAVYTTFIKGNVAAVFKGAICDQHIFLKLQTREIAEGVVLDRAIFSMKSNAWCAEKLIFSDSIVQGLDLIVPIV